MFLFQRLFAVFYSLLIKLRRNKIFRHLNRGGGEDFGAMCLVLLSQVYIIFFIFLALKKIVGYNIPKLSDSAKTSLKISLVIVSAVWIYLGYRYFLANRERKNKFIDSISDLNDRERKKWNAIGLFFIFMPFWIFIWLIVRKYY